MPVKIINSIVSLLPQEYNYSNGMIQLFVRKRRKES